MKQVVETKKSKETPASPARKKNDPKLRLWATHRQESVYFQREAQVNFWTVLGGLAMAALLTQLAPLLNELQAGRWYLLLYLVTSILILATSWVQTSWGSLVLKWPISIFTTVSTLFAMLAQSIQCLLVTNPSGWLAATAGIVLFAVAAQVYFEKSGAWKVFPAEFVKRFRFNNVVYAFFIFLCLAGAFQLYRYPSRIAEMVWGFVALFFSILALYMQHKGMMEEKRELGIP
jgi:hypothetical protein